MKQESDTVVSRTRFLNLSSDVKIIQGSKTHTTKQHQYLHVCVTCRTAQRADVYLTNQSQHIRTCKTIVMTPGHVLRRVSLLPTIWTLMGCLHGCMCKPSSLQNFSAAHTTLNTSTVQPIFNMRDAVCYTSVVTRQI